MQTRDAPGPQQRAQARHHDLVAALRAARLPAVQRAVLVDHVETAIVHDEREPLGGARHLTDLADDLPDLPGLRETARRLATAFVHPSLR